MGNVTCWNDQMSALADVEFLLFLDCPHEVMSARLLERGKTSGRSDDNLASIEKRLVTYEGRYINFHWKTSRFTFTQ